NHWQDASQIPAKTPISERLAKEFKAQGFKFMGPTVAYAFMQAVGMVNDHETSCDRHRRLAGGEGHVLGGSHGGNSPPREVRARTRRVWPLKFATAYGRSVVITARTSHRLVPDFAARLFCGLDADLGQGSRRSSCSAVESGATAVPALCCVRSRRDFVPSRANSRRETGGLRVACIYLRPIRRS